MPRMKKSEILKKLNKAIEKQCSIIEEEKEPGKVSNASNALVALVKTYEERFGFEDDTKSDSEEVKPKNGVIGKIGGDKGF